VHGFWIVLSISLHFVKSASKLIQDHLRLLLSSLSDDYEIRYLLHRVRLEPCLPSSWLVVQATWTSVFPIARGALDVAPKNELS